TTLMLTVAPAPPQNINGTVLSIVGTPAAGVSVRVDSMRVTTTDGDGKFTLSDVTPPYVISATPDGASASPIFYVGLTRKDPTLVALDYAGMIQRGRATGTISGVEFGMDTYLQLVTFGGQDLLPSPSTQTVDNMLRTYDASVVWLGLPTASVT